MIVHRLREATGLKHRLLEEKVDVDRLTSEPERYQWFLQSMFGYYRAIEPPLTRWGALVEPWRLCKIGI